MAKRNTSSKRHNSVAAPDADVITSPVVEVAPAEQADVAEPAEEITPEQDAADAGAALRAMAEKYEIPDRTGGPNSDRHEILSISGFREIGGVMHAIAYCDDRCTYDVPLTAKPE